jgi:hypothetical protein
LGDRSQRGDTYIFFKQVSLGANMMEIPLVTWGCPYHYCFLNPSLSSNPTLTLHGTLLSHAQTFQFILVCLQSILPSQGGKLSKGLLASHPHSTFNQQAN